MVLIPVAIRTRAKIRRMVSRSICCTTRVEIITPIIMPAAKRVPQSKGTFLPKRLKFKVFTIELKKITVREVPMISEGGEVGKSV